MRKTYGDKLRFVAFEVKIGDKWLNVPSAESIVTSFGLDFVPYEKIPTTIESLKCVARHAITAIGKERDYRGKEKGGDCRSPS
jgi:hypothetical protein